MSDALTWPLISVPCGTCIANPAMWVVNPTSGLAMVYCPHSMATGEIYRFQPHDPSKAMSKKWIVNCPITEEEFEGCLKHIPELLREWRWRWKDREHVTQPKGERL